MRDKLGDKQRLLHIQEAISEIERYTHQSTFKDFTENSMMRFAVVKQVEIIGEAANHLSSEIIILSKEVDWATIISARNIFVHEYFGIDDFILWDIVKIDLPDLKIKIASILQNLT